MRYQENITRNLPIFSPPGLLVTLRRVSRTKVQFQIRGGGRSLLLRCDRPDIFTFEETKKQVRKLFLDSYRQHEIR